MHRMKSITSTATIEKFREMFATHVVPATLVSDNGSNFTSLEFQEFMKKNGTKHIKVARYHPASNGFAEKAVRIFKEGYEKMEGGSYHDLSFSNSLIIHALMTQSDCFNSVRCMDLDTQ